MVWINPPADDFIAQAAKIVLGVKSAAEKSSFLTVAAFNGPTALPYIWP